MAELTPKLFNDEIIKLRGVFHKAKVHFGRKSIVRIKKLEKGHKPDAAEKVVKIKEEMHSLGQVKPDELSKVALINTKTSDELLTTLKGKTSVERLMAKLMLIPVYQKEIDSFRARFPKWHQEVPFLLQRFGNISKTKNSKKPKEKDILVELRKALEQGKNVPSVSVTETVKAKESEKLGKQLKRKAVNGDLSAKQQRIEEEPSASSSHQLTTEPARDKPDRVFIKGAITTDKIKNELPDNFESGECVIKKIKMDDGEEQFKAPLIIPNLFDDEDEESPVVSSSFFIGGGNDEEDGLDIDTPKQKNSEKPKYSQKIFENRKGAGMMKKGSTGKAAFKSKVETPKSARQKFDSKSAPRTFDGKKDSVKTPVDVKGKMHPSWIAKQNEKARLSLGYQGKKTVFED
uniref:SRF-dependent transcription regulation-associated protein n=1 Tax=Rhabditophanes sp. KR3021 TaxID=114890 RepID=A0AC35TUF1_9BILA